MVIVIMFPTQPKLALAVFIAYTHHTCVSNKKKYGLKHRMNDVKPRT